MGEDNTPDADGDFGYAPVLLFSDARLRFGARWFGGARDDFGSVSAFLPQ